MTALLTNETSNSAVPAFATRLFLTWACSLLWGFGSFLSAFALLSAIITGLLNYFDPPAWNASSILMFLTGLLAIFLAPFFLGTFLAHSWRKGLTSGLLALFMATVGFLLVYELAGFLYETFSDHSEAYYALLSGFPAAFAILTVLLWNRLPSSTLGIALGLVIGLGITLVDSTLLGQNLLVNNDIFHLLWQVPPLTWVSIVFFFEPTAVRNKPAGFLIWSLLMLITVGLPFLIVPLFSLQ
ncbi:MAG: hypothetical protein WCC12_01785 [Anaerolineales bacterium]